MNRVRHTPADPTRSAFLAAIVAAPDDDTPRLVYADWLDENGDPDRAEFIRVQIERAKLPAKDVEFTPGKVPTEPPPPGVKWGVVSTFRLVCGGPKCRLLMGDPIHLSGCRWDELQKRETELLDADPGRSLDWFDLPRPWARIVRLTPFDRDPDDYPYIIARRGFADVWCGSWGVCRTYLDAILAEHPVAEVRLTRRPTSEQLATEFRRRELGSKWVDEMMPDVRSGIVRLSGADDGDEPPTGDDELRTLFGDWWPRVKVWVFPPAV